VNIDESLEDGEHTAEPEELFVQARELLAFEAPGTEFQQRYAAARDADPNILMESSTLYRLLRG
ncbi:MAG TPA: hypothetical protein VIQ62_02460, partial [Burkholderiales bacterium]